MKVAFNSLLNSATDSTFPLQIQRAARKESGAWIHALPMSSLGLRIDDDAIRVINIRVAIGLWLGTPLCHPYIYYQCGSQVDQLGLLKELGSSFSYQ